MRRVATSPRDSAAAIRWAWSASRRLRHSLRTDGIDALGSVPPAPVVAREHRPTVVLVLRATGASCLVRSAVLQRWDADHGRPRELVIGVARNDETVTAHAWLAGEGHAGPYVELHRRARALTVPFALSPEVRVLVAAASPSGPGLPDLAPLDWHRVLQLARVHRVSPLVWRGIAGASFAGVPLAVRSELAGDHEAASMRNLVNLGELRRLTGALEAAGIPTIALKGAALLDRVYDDVGLRPMVDLDLLVRANDIARAEEVVLGFGYTSRRPGDTAFGLGTRHGEKYTFPELVRTDGLVRVDLHRDLLPDHALDVAGVWTRALPTERAFRVPSDEDLVLHLALHFFRDRVRRSDGSIGQLADIAWTVARLEPDWDEIVGRARGDGVAGRLYLALDAGERVLPSGVPRETLASLRPDGYSDGRADQFVTRRVLDCRPWYRPGLGRVRAATALLRPLRLRRDLALHRWMHEVD